MRAYDLAGFLLGLAISVALLMFAAGCSSTPEPRPVPQAPPAVEVLVPIATPCAVEQVEPSALPSGAGVRADIFDAVKTILADRRVLIGDRERLQAANSNPCPGGDE